MVSGSWIQPLISSFDFLKVLNKTQNKHYKTLITLKISIF